MYLIYLFVDMFYRIYYLKVMIVVIKGFGIFFLDLYFVFNIKGKKKVLYIYYFLINIIIYN